MNRTLIILFCAIALSSTGVAQSSQPNQISLPTYVAAAQRETQFMRDSLALTSEQAAQVDTINKVCLGKISVLEGQSIAAHERKQKIAEYKSKRDEELQLVLTTQQWQRYKDLRKAQEDRMKARVQAY
jgi:hypothetical protein